MNSRAPSSEFRVPHSAFAAPHSAIRILVVDDEPYVREVLSRHLEDDGYQCDTAGNAMDAWRKLQDGEFELLISDIMMPEVSGVELLKKARESFPDLAVIMLTAVDDRDTATEALELGAYGYMIKPFEKNEVLINVANALKRRDLEILRDRYDQQLTEEVRERTAEVRQTQEEITLRLTME